MKKKFQVFVSSTYKDLIEERTALTKPLLALNCIPVGMEEFPAADEEQLDFINRIIDESDFYLLIIGGCYGSTGSDGISFTEKEYNYAVSKEKYVLAFIPENMGKIPSEKTEPDPKKKNALENFIAKVSERRLVKKWSDTNDLVSQVLQSLAYAINEDVAVGYVRADQYDTEDFLKQINKLRIENEELKTQLNESKEVAINISDVADLDETYEFIGIKNFGTTLIDRPNLENFDQSWVIKITDTWVNIFSAIATNFSMGASDDEVREILNSYFTRKAKVKSFYISDESFNTIKIQLMAQSVFNDDGDWFITEKGKKVLLFNNAVRTKKNTKSK